MVGVVGRDLHRLPFTLWHPDNCLKLVSIVDKEHNTGTRYVWEGDNVREVYSKGTPKP